MRDRHIIAIGAACAALVTGVILYSITAYNNAVAQRAAAVESARP